MIDRSSSILVPLRFVIGIAKGACGQHPTKACQIGYLASGTMLKATFALAINVKSALGLTILPSLILQADHVIE